jgi:Holliday junction resolvase RusA-like endonuclease
MALISEAQLRELQKRGAKVIHQAGAQPASAQKAVSAAKKPAKTAKKPDAHEDEEIDGDEDEPVAGGKGRKRAMVEEYEFEPIEFRIDLPYNPRPKRRPRTVLNPKVIRNAFLGAQGNVAKFFGLLKDPKTGKSRAQVTMTPQATVDYENLVRDRVRQAMGSKPPFSGPVKVELLFVLDGDRNKWPTSTADGDADNLEKAVADALNEIAFEDDRFIVITPRMKICRPGERGVLVRVSAASPADLAFHGLLERWDQLRV